MISAARCTVWHQSLDQLRCWHAAAAPAAWLHANELQTWQQFRHRGRRETWLFGRLMVKELILRHVNENRTRSWKAADLQVRSRDAANRRVRPYVVIDGRLAPWSLSIAHSQQSVAVGVCHEPGLSIGVDVTPVIEPSRGFFETWFSPAEQRWARESDAPDAASTVWSVKEAFYKAVNQGEPFVPGTIEVQRNQGQFECLYRGRVAADCEITVEPARDQVLAVVTVPGNER
ncbi:MAG TPA: 4'-phosphopantetheinyl transferase superfamily protein, partial [Reyranella sp.]|nr:4'-phosphopantetheinyl transferase superfamily protein [Reyranella sp.]